MWSRIKKFVSGVWRNSAPGVYREPAPPPARYTRVMPRIASRLPLFLCCLALACQLFSCAGYQLAGKGTSIIGDGTKTLKVKRVDYPTLQPWLPHAIRSILRDEIGARNLARWVDSGSADYEIQINVISFTTREFIRSQIDTALLYSTNLTLEAIIYDGSTNREIWRSGAVAYSEELEDVDEKAASSDIITQVIRRLADKMRNTF